MLKRIKQILHIEPKKVELSVYEKIDNLFESLNEDTIVVYLGTDLEVHGELICKIIGELREEIKEECGFIIPPVRIKTNEVIQENQCDICIRGNIGEQLYLVPTEENIRSEFYESMKSAIYDNVNLIFTNEIAEKYINRVQQKNSWLIWNITNILSVVDIRIILSDIINKGKSIGEIDYVFEKIGEQVLSYGEYRDCQKKYNPHIIAKEVVSSL